MQWINEEDEISAEIGDREIEVKVKMEFIFKMLRNLKERTGAETLKEAIEFVHWVFTGKELEDVMLFVKIYRLAKTRDTKPPLSEKDLENMYRRV